MRPKSIQFLKKHWATIALVLILLLASVLRFYSLALAPPALNQDEAVNGYDAYSIGKTLRDHHGKLLPLTLTSFGDSASVALTYLTIPFVLVGGLNETSVRIPIALTGVASVLLMYLLFVTVTKRKDLALLSAFMLAITPWHITFTRWAVPPSIVLFFALLFLWLFAKAKVATSDRSRYTYLVLSAIAAGGLVYSYPAAEIVGPFLVLAAGIIFLWREWKRLLTYFSSFALMAVPLFYLIVFHSSTNFARFSAVRLEGTPVHVLIQAIKNYCGYFTPEFFFSPQSTMIMMHVPGSGNFLTAWFAFVVIIIGLLVYKLYRHGLMTKVKLKAFFKQHETATKIGLFLAIWVILAPVPAALGKDQLHPFRSVMLLSVTSILLPIVIYFLFKIVRPRTKVFFIATFVILSVIGLLTYTTYYFGQYIRDAAAEYQYGLKESYQQLAKIDSAYSRVIVDLSINQPYIFYLFYNSYNPRAIDYSSLNTSLINKWANYYVPQVGSYVFRPITDDDLSGAKMFYEVKNNGTTWYTIYAKDSSLILKKSTAPSL